MSAGWPATTALAWLVEAPYDWLKPTPVPSGVAWKAEMIFAITGFGRRVGDERRGLVPFVAAAAAASEHERREQSCGEGAGAGHRPPCSSQFVHWLGGKYR